MTSAEGPATRSPLVTVWLSPRQTIERIITTRPTHLVWPLAIIGAIAGFYNQIASIVGAGDLFDWRLALGFVLLGALVGIVLFYLSALVWSWIGRLFGGQAPALQLRAVLAWSALPTILGFIVVLAIGGVANGNAITLRVVPLLALCFGLWSLVVFLLMFGRVEHFGFWRTIAAYLLNGVLAFLIALFIRTLLYQPFNIPATSMAPTLLVGDYFFASKFAYGYSRYSLPFSPPLFSGRIFASEPERGDVVVFRAPKDTTTDYIKRVVGLPGDRIQMKQGLLYINDTPVKRERLADFVGNDVCGGEAAGAIKRWREILPSGRSYETLDCVDNGFLDNTNVFTVPEGHFFVLGDNRDNSTDSRVPSQIGYVPFDNLIGRASITFFSRDGGSKGAAPHVRTDRIGMVVR